MFISCSSLWSNFNCVDADKTRVYLERSRSSPINLRLSMCNKPSSLDLFLQITSQAIGRLKSLSIKSTPGHLEAITAHLSHPTPLLERLEIDGGFQYLQQRNSVLTSTIFDGDLSSLRVLNLECVRTELPWRNMANLTSFRLCDISAGTSSIGRLLDFLESAPQLRSIYLYAVTLVSDGENGRLISLDHLKRMVIIECGPTSILLDHLVIPIGAKLETGPSSTIEDHIPRSLNNLKNLSDFTTIHIRDNSWPCLRLSGPNGQVSMIAERTHAADLVFKSLARFETSKSERLEINIGIPRPGNTFYRTLLPIENLRTLILVQCINLCVFMDVLNPNKGRSRKVVCPLLEGLTFGYHLDKMGFDSLIGMAAARASRGVKLGIVMVVKDEGENDLEEVLELRKHVSRVEYGPEIDPDDDESDDYDSG